jgi:hypothetical protein
MHRGLIGIAVVATALTAAACGSGSSTPSGNGHPAMHDTHMTHSTAAGAHLSGSGDHMSTSSSSGEHMAPGSATTAPGHMSESTTSSTP